jgi:adenylate cyclase
LLCLVALTALDLVAPFAYVRARNLLRDAITRAGRKTPPNPNLVFLAIDSASVGQDVLDLGELYDLSEASPTELRALTLMGHAWPWPREVHALVLDRLVKAGAKAVLFDLLFPSPAADDEKFRLALEEHADRVVIGSNFVSAASRDFTTLSATHSRPPDSLVLQTTPLDPRVAYTNFWPDEDDVVRHAQFRTTFEQVQGVMPGSHAEQYLSLGARGLVKAGFADRVPSGFDAKIFRYTAPPRAGFRPYSLFEIFVPEYWKRNYKSGEFFRDKIIVVGAEGNWAQDEHATPFGSMPGPELHLNAINAALHGEFIEVVSQRSRTAVTIIAGLSRSA